MRVSYTFTYFDVRGESLGNRLRLLGLGEQIRLLLVDNGIIFDEKRIDDLHEWSQMKHRFVSCETACDMSQAFNQLPCLQDDDVKIVQSATIMRHLARKHGGFIR